MGGPFEIRIGEHVPDRAEELQSAKTPVNYTRQAAIDYALFFCSRVVSDGVVMSGGHVNRRKPGALLNEIKPVDDENDCTHFVSCSLGTPPPFTRDDGVKLSGGGIYLSRDEFLDRGEAGVYGCLQPSRLLHWLQRTKRIAFARIDANGALAFSSDSPQFFSNTTPQIDVLKKLIQDRFTDDKGKGDLVAYYVDPDKSPHHSALLVNDDWGIACHTSTRCGAVPINNVGLTYLVYARFKQFKEDEL